MLRDIMGGLFSRDTYEHTDFDSHLSPIVVIYLNHIPLYSKHEVTDDVNMRKDQKHIDQ